MGTYRINIRDIVDEVKRDAILNFHVLPDDICTYEIVVPVLGSGWNRVTCYIPKTRGFRASNYSGDDNWIEFVVPNYKGDTFLIYGDYYYYEGNPKARDDVRAYFDTYHHIYRTHLFNYKNNGAYRESVEYRIDYKILKAKGERKEKHENKAVNS